MTGESPLAKARRLAQAGESEAAEQCIAEVLQRLFALEVQSVELRRDVYSLNSLNGFITTTEDTEDGTEENTEESTEESTEEIREYFFKFHQEEGEEDISAGEYYNAGILQEAGLPVETPLFANRESGWQILLYRRVADPRFSDLCRATEGDASDTKEIAPLIAAQQKLDLKVGEALCQTLHQITEPESAAEPIHRLFYWRLVEGETAKQATTLGGRVARFYQGQDFALPDGTVLDWNSFSRLQWRINGMHYEVSIGDLLARAVRLLSPAELAKYGGVVAHGDAHNANIFASEDAAGAGLSLRYFDPAFAGQNVPALLAEVKATFHNSFAHPYWLYEPDEAESAFAVSAQSEGNTLVVEHDWQVSPLRAGILTSKVKQVWLPLLQVMQSKGFIRSPDDKAQALQTIGIALFCCPTLVLPLRAGAPSGLGSVQNATSSILGWALAISAAEASVQEKQGEAVDNPFAEFRTALRAALG